MNSVHNPDAGLYCPFIKLKVSFPSPLTATPHFRPFTFSSPVKFRLCTTNQHLTGMRFQSDDEEPGNSVNSAERGLREDIMLRHFVPVNMLSERTVESMKKMERRRRRGLVVHRCHECNYATPDKSDLVNHSRTHSKEKTFHCELCDQKFSQKGNLKVHVMSHKEGRFECKECDYKAARKSTLVTHLLTHSGVKPHKCDSCEFSTATKSNLMVHQR